MKLIDILKSVFTRAKADPDQTRAKALGIIAEVREVANLVRDIIRSGKAVHQRVVDALDRARVALAEAKAAAEADTTASTTKPEA